MHCLFEGQKLNIKNSFVSLLYSYVLWKDLCSIFFLDIINQKFIYFIKFIILNVFLNLLFTSNLNNIISYSN